MTSTVVVGFSDTRHGRSALYWAAQEAMWRNADLTVCHVWDVPYGGSAPETERIAARMASCTLSEGVFLAQQILDPDRVMAVLARGSAGTELLRLTADAEMLVLGSRSASGVSRLRIGSATAYIARRTQIPLAIVRNAELATAHDERAVVVAAVDASALSDRTIELAFQEAMWRRASLYAVCGTWHDRSANPDRRWFDNVLPNMQRSYPDVAVKAEVVGDRNLANVLLPVDDVEVVVVGAADRATLVRLLDQALASQTSCTAIVAPRQAKYAGPSALGVVAAQS